MMSNVSKCRRNLRVSKKSKEVPCHLVFCSLILTYNQNKKFAFALNLLPLTFKAFRKAILIFILHTFVLQNTELQNCFKHFSFNLDSDYISTF